ncbi:hypothetical protein [Streptomyces sp. NBC_01264]|uniref:hypothetical protein n=1 Tax=Streptomyces sp. NBC_01264 TaxID=2903804 RepID=UPI002252D456|nr:hypothetical protein [Streptomyces sp. NBC_01264]MCX4784276.1 hypothetical protein [Streptomyces sp. NBC_01264]
MQSDDKNFDGQPHPNTTGFWDVFNQAAPPPASAPDKDPGTNLAQLHAAWTASWEPGGFLYRRWEELRQVPKAGWHTTANWIKALLVLAGVCALIILLEAAGDIFDGVLRGLAASAPNTTIGTSTSSEFWDVVDRPVRVYIDQHTAGLAVSGAAAYTFWQLAGLFGLIGGFMGITGARITWTVWGAVTATATWTTTPADGRTVATVIAVLAWTIASTFALRGLSLRPVINNYAPVQPQIEIRPEIHVPAQPAPPADETPDNVHPIHH